MVGWITLKRWNNGAELGILPSQISATRILVFPSYLRFPNLYHAFLQTKIFVVKWNELLDKQPAYYTFKILFTMGLLAVGVTFLIVVNNFGYNYSMLSIWPLSLPRSVFWATI